MYSCVFYISSGKHLRTPFIQALRNIVLKGLYKHCSASKNKINKRGWANCSTWIVFTLICVSWCVSSSYLTYLTIAHNYAWIFCVVFGFQKNKRLYKNSLQLLHLFICFPCNYYSAFFKMVWNVSIVIKITWELFLNKLVD